MSTVEPIRSEMDLLKIENYLKNKNYRDFVLFCTGINSGLRISDILKLNVGDVADKNFVRLREQKTNKFKVFPINKKLKKLFKQFTKNKSSKEPLFLSINNNRLDRISAYRIINNACKNLGIKENVGTHTLRKTFGYHFYKKFKDVAMLQKIFNHESPYTTLTYIGITEDEIFKNYEKFIL